MRAIAPSKLPANLRWMLVALAAAGFPLGLLIIVLTWWNASSWLGALLVSFSPLVAVRLYGRFFRPQDVRPAMRRYNRRLTLNMVVYFLTLAAGVALYERGLTGGPLGYLVAAAPALPIVNCFVLMGRWLREESDELVRAMTLEGIVWAGGLTLGEATVWGFLETFGKVPNLWMWIVPLAFFAQFGITAPLVARKYR